MINLKKITAIATSTLMVGLTMGTAVAANFPAPFVTDGAANVAVVYGTGSGVSDLDQTGATTIQTNLKTYVTSSGSVIVEGEDSYKFEKTSQKLWLGSGLLDASKTTLNDDNFATLLADGKFVGTDNEEYDFNQKVNVANLTYSMFNDNDYKSDTPTLGFKIDGSNVLNYTLTFDDVVPFNKLVTKDLTMMGRSYYVLSKNAANTTITLLDSAQKLMMSEGETKTVTVDGKTFEVSVDFISSTPKVKFVVNGASTTLLADEATEKIEGGYIGVKEVLYTAKESGVSRVEFAIGSGKLELINNSEIKMNDQVVTGITSTITNSSGNLASVVLRWDADGDQFIAEDKTLTMPGFGALKLSYTGMEMSTSEKIVVDYDGRDSIVLKQFPIKDGLADINILYSNETAYVGLGKDSSRILVTGNGTSITFDASTDSYFVASYADTNEGESYLLRATSFVTEDDVNKTTIQRFKDGSWSDVKTVKIGDEVSMGNVDLGFNSINRVDKSVIVTANNTGVEFDTLYSKEGLKVWLPQVVARANYTATPLLVDQIKTNVTAEGYTATTTYNLRFREEDKDGKVNAGSYFNVTLGLNTQDPKRVTVSTLGGITSGLEEVGDTDKDKGFVYSALATEVLHDRSGDQDKVEITYHGGESYGGAYISSPNAVTQPTQMGVILALDNEADKLSANNLIVVGGSCINAVAAKLLDSNTPICGAAFTTKTEIGAGEAIIKAYSNPYASGKTALLVAGYNAADTNAAVSYLINKKPDTSVGLKVKSATEAIVLAA